MNQNSVNEPGGEAWEYFLDEAGKLTEKTQHIYTRYMKRFLETFKPRGRTEPFTPDMLYEYFKSHLESDDRRKIRKLETELHEYYHNLLTNGVNIQTGEPTGLHVGTVSNYESAVLCYLKGNYLKDRLSYRVNFNSDTKSKHREHFTTNGKDKAEVEEIRKLLDYMSNPRNISAVLTMRDTGLRVSDLVNLKVKHIQPILDDPELEWYTFEITPVKNMRQDTPLPANPVMGPESVEALRTWMKHRINFYELKPDPESYVYCAIHEYPSVDGRDPVHIGDKVLPTAYSRMMRYKRRKAGLEKPISPHSLRKTHSTNLTGGGVPERWVNVMQGKKGRGTQGAYQKPNREELIQVYKKAYPSLSTYRSEKLETLREELEEQRRENIELDRRLREAERYIEQQKMRQVVREELKKQG